MSKPKLKIAIAVHGRFHAFDLAKAVLEQGHDVMLFTNYPKWAVARFGFPPARVRSFWVHGISSRVVDRLHKLAGCFDLEPRMHTAYGRWLARELAKESWDVVHGWSGVSEEHLRGSYSASLKLLLRGSAHIRTQHAILESEQERSGCEIELPSAWIMTREEREYEAADHIVVLSKFAFDSFVAQGIDRSKLRLMPLGANTDAFRPAPEVVEERCRRILSTGALRVLYVGALSFRKGLHDIAAVIRTLGARFQFRLIGPIVDRNEPVLAEIRQHARLEGKRPQSELPKEYAWGDVFIFPTLEDGFAIVLAQANAGAVPILTTANCCGPDLIHEGRTGWVLPIRSPEAFIERLLWCDSHRRELAEMVRLTYYDFRPRDWSDVASDFEDICTEGLTRKRCLMKAADGQ